MTRKKVLTLQEQAEKMLKIAQAGGVEHNFFFITTFKRYQVQMRMLSELEQRMNEDDVLVEKEYIKGRKNLYVNPAVGEYNKTTDSANRTVTTLIRIITDLRMGGAGEKDKDPLLAYIYGGK
jgi:hypothetical protein